MLRVHFMQQWFTLSDPAMEEAFVDTPLYRQFAQIEEFTRLPDESTILRFRHRLEKHKPAEQVLDTVNVILEAKDLLLKHGTVVYAEPDAFVAASPFLGKHGAAFLQRLTDRAALAEAEFKAIDNLGFSRSFADCLSQAHGIIEPILAGTQT